MSIFSIFSVFSRFWIEISGEGPKDVAKKLKEGNWILKGHRDTGNIKILEKYIPIAAIFGGICIGIITIAADFLGAIGSGNFFYYEFH